MPLNKTYTKEELRQLHDTLYEILAEISRVCEKLKIHFFLTGGSVIGAKFWQGIIAWDDDIDIGMKREDYEIFLREAPKILQKKYFLQWYGSDPHTPFYFAKLRKNGTVFQEEIAEGLGMHNGIYIDIFPFDKIPDNKTTRKWQRKLALLLDDCFFCKEVWPYQYFGKCKLSKPFKQTVFHMFKIRLLSMMMSRSFAYKCFCKVQQAFNFKPCKYYGQMMIKNEIIPADEIDKVKFVKFGNKLMPVPFDSDLYLKNHYGKVEKYPPEEMRVTHKPTHLSF